MLHRSLVLPFAVIDEGLTKKIVCVARAGKGNFSLGRNAVLDRNSTLPALATQYAITYLPTLCIFI